MKINTTYLLLGANLGERLKTIQAAVVEIERLIGKIVAQSAVYETAAWGVTAQPAFLNQVVEIDTPLHPIDVLYYVLKIEKSLGRERREHWGARTIDIDVLYYADVIMKMSDLIIPHPRLHERRFTLVPLAEIAPQYVHPVFKKTNEQLLMACEDDLQVSLYQG
jgi:2-amino-4-hydroxy-6-hydroxymethyldihydropteridine diphosphokinase